MGKKLYEEAAVRAIADAIRSKNHGAESYTIGEMAAAVRALPQVEAICWNQCPEQVRGYLASVSYDPEDCTVSRIEAFAPAVAVESNYRPVGVAVGDETFYNTQPGTETAFAVQGAAGTLRPMDALRWVQTASGNIRDMGGWTCDGGTVKYGLLFRGGEISPVDQETLVGELGVRHDLNLRGEAESPWPFSPLGSRVYFHRVDLGGAYSLESKEAWKAALRCVFDAVSHGEPVYYHDAQGADRAGTLACVLEGLLGMSRSDVDKDYELTCFYTGTGEGKSACRRTDAGWLGLMEGIRGKAGDSFRDKCVCFAEELGFTLAEINTYRRAMIDGLPDTIV